MIFYLQNINREKNIYTCYVQVEILYKLQPVQNSMVKKSQLVQEGCTSWIKKINYIKIVLVSGISSNNNNIILYTYLLETGTFFRIEI